MTIFFRPYLIYGRPKIILSHRGVGAVSLTCWILSVQTPEVCMLLIFSADYILLLVLGDDGMYSETIKCLESFSNQI